MRQTIFAVVFALLSAVYGLFEVIVEEPGYGSGLSLLGAPENRA